MLLYRLYAFLFCAFSLPAYLLGDDTPSKNPQCTPPAPGEPVFPLNIENPLKDNAKFATDFLNMIATLVFFLAIILVVAWFFKKMTKVRLEQANAASSIKVLEQRTLSPKTLLYLLEVEDKVILIAESQNGVTHLSDFSSPPISSDVPPDFRNILDNKNNSKKS